MDRPAAIATLLMGALLAGCSDPGPQAPQASGEDQAARLKEADQAAQGVDVEATATTGLIRGVVVDGAIRPLAGVVVALEGTSLAQTTGADGAFGFDGLQAGTYFLVTARERHESMRVGVVVEAGKSDPAPVRVVMLALPGTTPFIEAFNGKMFIAFSMSFIGSFGGDDIGMGDPDRLIFTMEPNATVVQMESEWAATTPTGEHLRMYGSVTETGGPCRSGPRPGRPRCGCATMAPWRRTQATDSTSGCRRLRAASRARRSRTRAASSS